MGGIEGLSATVIAEPGISRAEWLNVRRRGIGGSDAAAVAGVSPWRSAYAVWLDKTGQLVDDDDDENSAMRRGRLLEPAIAQAFGEEHPEYELMPTPGTLQHSDLAHMIVNLDFVGMRDGKAEAVIECKTAGPRQADAWDDGVPGYYVAQVIHEMAVSGLRRGFVSALVAGNGFDFRVYEVPWDDELAEMLTDVEAEFWQRNVLGGEPPTLEGPAQNHNMALRRAIAGKSIEVGADVVGKLREIKRFKEQAKVWESQAESLIADVQACLGDAVEATYQGKPVVSWKTTERKGYTVKPTTVRTLRVLKGATSDE